MEQELIIIRGLPGSGKSTMAKQDFPDHDHFETDMHWTDDEGNYNFKQETLGDAIDWCNMEAMRALKLGKLVVVINTFIKRWHFSKIAEYAASLGIPCRIIVAEGNYGSIHNVPEHVIERMRQAWED